MVPGASPIVDTVRDRYRELVEGSDDAVTGLALRAAAGDPGAVDEFVRATHLDVWRFCSYLADRTRADDLTQETFLRAITALPRFAGRSTARTWLLSIARRVVVDQIRYETSRPPSALFDQDDKVVNLRTHGGGRHEERVEWTMLVDELTAERREAFLLTQILGMSYTEAAEVCGCPVGTIRSRVARARDDLLAAHSADNHDVG